jgi:hypothetical protein
MGMRQRRCPLCGKKRPYEEGQHLRCDRVWPIVDGQQVFVASDRKQLIGRAVCQWCVRHGRLTVREGQACPTN